MQKSLVVASCALALSLPLFAAPAKKKPAPASAPVAVAPAEIAHSTALFLATLSRHGTTQVTFKANAMATRFFFEEPAGVTVYRFEKGEYRKEEFLKGSTLAKAMKKYGE
ncbi:MAG TPA: hypothetical protein VFN10_13795 [Thermoanaerobaculia bacterium]|nr:hypothetical protein [Thermoanaerobaculia bacterium]